MGAEEVRVGIAEYKTGKAPAKIITVGLGSCIGIAFYDKIKKIGGLAHIMLPDSTQFSKVSKPGKFADLAVLLLLQEMEALGANRRSITAKIGGGASMFNFSDRGLVMDIGSRNIKSVKEMLEKLSIPLKGEDVGGSQGRTMILDADSGRTYIKTVGKDIKEI